MFKDMIGDTPEARILDFLLLHPHTSHTLAKIIEGTSLNFRTAQKKIDGLVKCNAVKVVHKSKRSRYYIINMENLIAEFQRISELWRKY